MASGLLISGMRLNISLICYNTAIKRPKAVFNIGQDFFKMAEYYDKTAEGRFLISDKIF